MRTLETKTLSSDELNRESFRKTLEHPLNTAKRKLECNVDADIYSAKFLAYEAIMSLAYEKPLYAVRFRIRNRKKWMTDKINHLAYYYIDNAKKDAKIAFLQSYISALNYADKIISEITG